MYKHSQSVSKSYGSQKYCFKVEGKTGEGETV